MQLKLIKVNYGKLFQKDIEEYFYILLSVRTVFYCKSDVNLMQTNRFSTWPDFGLACIEGA